MGIGPVRSEPALEVPVPYIDDIHVYGRVTGQSEVTEDRAVLSPPRLLPSVPNPARGRASIEFVLPEPMKVRLEILDLAGRRVGSLLDGHEVTAGYHAHDWNGRDERGLRLPAGVYLYRLVTERGSSSRRVVLLD